MDKEIAQSGIDPLEVISLMKGEQRYLDEEDNLDIGPDGKKTPNPMLRSTLTLPELEILLNDPIIKSDYSRTDLNREGAFNASLKKLGRLIQLSREGKIPQVNYQSYTMYTLPMGGLISTSVGHGMFEGLIRFWGTEEQVKTYVKDCVDYKVINIYFIINKLIDFLFIQ